MQKFISLLCAILLVFSASAAPVAQKAQLVKKAPVAVEQAQKVQFEKAQTLNLNQLSATPALKVTNQKAQAPAILGKKVVKANHAAPAVAAAPAKAPKAVAEDINVTAVDWYYDDYYYDVYLNSETETYLFELQEDLVYGKTYTLADMYSDWVCTLDEEGYPKVSATDATLTVSKDEAGLTHIAATMVLNGDNHIIAYDEKPFEPSGVQINLDGTELSGQYYFYYGMYVYTAKVGANEIQLAFDATEEQATYTKDQLIANYCVYTSPDYSTYVEFVKAASDFTVTNTETTKTLAGSLYASNGDEYILNLVYEKPAAKEININVADADLNTRTLTAGFWTIGGTTADKNNSVNIYFISKALQGTFTDVAQFDAYSTWVSDKSTGTNVYYENLSAVNLTSAVVVDSLVIEGTLNLADASGNAAIVTVHITSPFAQEWGDWADFAPFDVNTGKYAFTAALETTQTNIPVQVRKDNTGLKQFKFIGWGKQVFTANGIDLLVDLAPDNSCTIVEQSTGAYQTSYSEYLLISDMNTYTGGTSYPSTYDPETGVFQLAVIYYISLGNFGYGYETMTMDKPIVERDTVKVTADMKIAAEPAKGIIKVSAETEDFTYVLEVVGADTIGTFSLADGTLSQKYYYGIVAKDGSVRSDFADGEVTISRTETGLALAGLMIGVDEKAYVLDWTFTPITTRDTVKVNLETIMVEEDVNSTTGAHRGWLYEGQDTDTLYIIQVLGNEQLGTFSYAAGTLGQNFYNIIPSNGQGRQQFTEGEVTIVEDEKGVKLTGLLIGEDEKAYVLNWIQPAGILQYDTDAPFDAKFAWGDMNAIIEDGVISISATNADLQSIGLELYTDPANTTIPAGTYVISDSYEAATALKSVGVDGGYLTECWAGVRAASGGIADCWFIVEGTITLSYDEYGKLKVVIDAKNSYGQPVTAVIAYEKVEPKSTVVVTDAELTINEEYLDQYGIVNFQVLNDTYGFDLYVYGDTIIGNYTEFDYQDTKIYNFTEGVSFGAIEIESVEVNGIGKAMTLKAKVLGADTILYDVTATGYYGALPYDQTSDFEATFELEKADVQTAAAGTGMTTLIVSNADNQMVALQFYAKADGNKLPARTYPINSTKGKNTVMASQGFTTSGPSYSFAAEIDGEGSITAPWWIVSGEVVVAEDGSIRVNALNSYDKTITISIVASATDLININADVKANKVVRNGRLMIIKDAKVYSVLGQQIQ